ncbi:HNH endonuclease [candidate division KSB1 bacterium]|nr:HNH endonuclease [candidate division KSB1 bacterium]
MDSIFSRRSPAPSESNYAKYRPYIREDFRECCAYCLMHETYAGGEENFELDHFRPKSRPEFSGLINEYANLYYACHPCNHQKHNHWPSEELRAKGFQFVDTCNESFSIHFEEDDGYWNPISNAGRYTEERLRLNSGHKTKIRKMIAEWLSLLGEPSIDWNRPLKSQIAIIVNLNRTECSSE